MLPSKAGAIITLQGGISTLSGPLFFDSSCCSFVASYRSSLYEIAPICVVMFAFAAWYYSPVI